MPGAPCANLFPRRRREPLHGLARPTEPDQGQRRVDGDGARRQRQSVNGQPGLLAELPGIAQADDPAMRIASRGPVGDSEAKPEQSRKYGLRRREQDRRRDEGRFSLRLALDESQARPEREA